VNIYLKREKSQKYEFKKSWQIPQTLQNPEN
jgi:hypothetical protein